MSIGRPITDQPAFEQRRSIVRFFIFSRQVVRDAFVAIDTGFAFFFRLHVFLVRRLLLQFGAHRIEVVAITAFA